MAAKKRFLLRMDPKLWVALERWAAEDLRSINGQIEFLLTQAARRAGAMGGKLLGAGGGGFLLVMAPRERHEAIREAVGRPREISFRIDRRGSRVIFISDRYTF